MPKLETYTDGELVSTTDDRTLADAQADRIAFLREATTAYLLKNGFDEITQRNASLGIYDEARTTEIKDGISAARTRYLTAKASVLAATTNDDVDAVNW